MTDLVYASSLSCHQCHRTPLVGKIYNAKFHSHSSFYYCVCCVEQHESLFKEVDLVVMPTEWIEVITPTSFARSYLSSVTELYNHIHRLDGLNAELVELVTIVKQAHELIKIEEMVLWLDSMDLDGVEETNQYIV